MKYNKKRMISQETFKDVLFSEKYNNLPSLLDCIQGMLQYNINITDSLNSYLINSEFLEEIKCFNNNEQVSFYFGKTLKDLKCVIKNEETSREHEIFFQYHGLKKLVITSASFPVSPLPNQDFNTIEDIVTACMHHLGGLTGYFHELECIDRCCTIMEPTKPSFKEDYRRILLDDRTWLHVEVTTDGLATNIHLIGQSEYWQEKLQEGLLKWDHDMDIVRNIKQIFELNEFPTLTNKSGLGPILEDEPVEKSVCSICLCEILPDIPGVPLPLCQNTLCGVYFHRSCLFQWLVACAGGRPPAFGVATGTCPTCLQPVACNGKDS